MKFVNPFTKYSLKAWTVAYAKAVALFIVVVAALAFLGYGVCSEPLWFSAVCEAGWFNDSIGWVSRVVGIVLPYAIKIFFIAYVARAVVGAVSLLSGRKGGNARPAPSPRPAGRHARRG
jgi:hypothetical protein